MSNDFVLVLFADYTNISVAGKDAGGISGKCNDGMSKICDWIKWIKLSLDTVKCHFMIFALSAQRFTDLKGEIDFQRISLSQLQSTISKRSFEIT